MDNSLVMRLKGVLSPTLLTCIILYLLGQTFFLINIQFPAAPTFDEIFYLQVAKQYLALEGIQNLEHPPLAKELMALSIALAGDSPLGWRFMSTVFGALTLVAMYLWALALFRDQRIARWVALLTLVNQILYVQARIAMLDTFMVGFLSFALAAFAFAWNASLDAKTVRRLLYFTGVMLGFATACKWFGVIAWAYCVGLIILVRLVQYFAPRFKERGPDPWYASGMWTGLKTREVVLALGVVPLAAYFITFLPFLFLSDISHGFGDLLAMQRQMWELQGSVVSPHPYMSGMSEWPLVRRPIWYAFDKTGDTPESYRGVLMFGNPLIMWIGDLAVVATLLSFLQERRRDAFLIVTAFGALYLSWAVIPRKVLYYYYYYPAGMVIGLAIAYLFHHGERGLFFKIQWGRWTFLAAAAAIFAYFFPILAALPVSMEKYRQMMWFRTWI